MKRTFVIIQIFVIVIVHRSENDVVLALRVNELAASGVGSAEDAGAQIELLLWKLDRILSSSLLLAIVISVNSHFIRLIIQRNNQRRLSLRDYLRHPTCSLLTLSCWNH